MNYDEAHARAFAALNQFARSARAAALEEAAAICDDTLKTVEGRISAIDAGILMTVSAQIRAMKEAT